MNRLARKIAIPFGAVLAILGVVIILVLLLKGGSSHPILFILTAIACLGFGVFVIRSSLASIERDKKILKNGKKRPAKIVGFLSDSRASVNGSPSVALTVRFFDDNYNIKEINVSTNRTVINNPYQIGQTMDIYELALDYVPDLDSLREEHIEGESELMADVNC